MAEKSLISSDGSGVFDAELMVRGVLRALENLGRDQPARASSVVLEELPESAGVPALPPPPTATPATTLLRRPRTAGASDPGVPLPTANDGQRAHATDHAGVPGPSAPETATTTASAASMRAPQPSPMMARCAALEQRLEEVQANSRRVWAEEGEVLREWDSYLAETPYGRQLAGK